MREYEERVCAELEGIADDAGKLLRERQIPGSVKFRVLSLLVKTEALIAELETRWGAEQ